MNQDLERSFYQVPGVDIQRSRMKRPYNNKFTMTEGDLVPFLVDEILPGDTYTVDTSFLMRMATPLFPVMDNAYIDFFYFFVPNRLVWDHWREFCGENTAAPWAQQVEYEIPQMRLDNNLDGALGPYVGVGDKSPLSYMGIPNLLGSGETDTTISDIPYRGYRLIWNEFFRDQNLQYPVPVYTDDSSRSISRDYGQFCLKANRMHDYFSSALPQPQKGGAVTLPLGDVAPVFAGEINTALKAGQKETLIWNYEGQDQGFQSLGLMPLGAPYFDTGVESTDLVSAGGNLHPVNLWSDLSSATSATINSLRQAFAVQRLLERDARGGTRYREMLQSHFSVTIPDATVQVPEYLGGDRVRINMDPVLQTSATDQTSPQGNAAGYSVTSSVQRGTFTKSFVEHGYLFGLACVRVEHSYSQGIEKMWSKKRRFDFYYPALANLGEQAVLRKEIYATGDKDDDEQVFGYQEAWAEYRYKPNRLTAGFGEQWSSDTGSRLQSPLAAAWTYSDYYTSAPFLDGNWIQEGSSNIGNTLAVQDTNEPQFICDFLVDLDCVRPMPIYSVPGLIDHN